MDLQSYIKSIRIQKKDFAKQIEVCIQTLSNYTTGRRMPKPKVIKAIERETKGKVTHKDLLDWYEKYNINE